MAIISDPKSDRGSKELLREAVETFLEVANIAQQNEISPNVKRFYSHLSCHCYRLLGQLSQAQDITSVLGGNLLKEAVSHLGLLIPESGLSEFGGYSVALETRLRMLSLWWRETKRQSHEAKLDFINRWLRPDISTEERQEVDTVLESLADTLDKQQPKQTIQRTIHKAASLDIGQPTFAVWKAAKSIFDALVDCRGCTCPSQHEYRAKLELGTYRTTEKNVAVKPARRRVRRHVPDDDVSGCLELNMFLTMEQDWHEFRVQDVREKTVHFASPSNKSTLRGSASRGKHTKVEKLCTPIFETRAKALQRLVLRLTSGELYQLGFEKSNIDKTTEPISLTQCFEERRDFFMDKTKRILSLIIGYTVLHLYGTSWLQSGWGSSSIKFFQTTSNTIPLRPFIETQLPKDGATDLADGSEDDEINDMDAGHCCPELVALAVVLLEINFVKPFSQLAAMHDIQLIETRSGRITLMDVDQVLEGEEGGEEGWRYQIPEESLLLEAIDNCLDPELWEDEGQPLDDETLRSRIYDKVVRPLQDHLTTGFGIEVESLDQYAKNLDFSKWSQGIVTQDSYSQSVFLSPKTGTPCRSPSPASLPLRNKFSISTQIDRSMQQYSQMRSMLPYSASDLDLTTNCDGPQRAFQFFDDQTNDGPMFANERERYKIRKQDYLNVYDKFVGRPFAKSTSTPVKIAILDTGIERGHALVEPREDSLKGKKNFYNPLQTNVADTHGHGTFTASLIMDYAPDAELYIAKIADKENTRPDASIVANAILHAIGEWQVDIISMSFGWPSSDFDGYEALEAAIDKAYSKKVLMFAAAANSGGRLSRAYPASSPHVICVHSTDALGNASDFSPTADPNSINIATVGECVESAWPSFLCDSSNYDCVKSRSGTSYAAPIVAGVAGFLLQYGRLHLTGGEAIAMKRRDRMEAVLRRCAERGPNYQPRGGYFSVDLSLEKQNLFGETLEWVSYEIGKVLKA
ncbi:unnamed protein product [Fusarium venenatum]|uniref:Uncharacterized protein n=1 Tax=Fusarium venenatum TaxID=56646 RepID=A0A2L2SRT8_9HYPO|nr:uncharacterized protein FVRRES_13715 [Fusarium venenatum]KAH6980227.1 hypothetical protein EDB82DRAFT_528287 [Fusarium venenatum]CEI41732.1 unnamed protein product [Fusarium venenatum]